MKNKLLLSITILFSFPIMVNAAVNSETNVTANTVLDDPTIKSTCEDYYKQNIGYNTQKNDIDKTTVSDSEDYYFLEVVGVKCKNSKNELTNIFTSKENSVTCTNGNTAPYFELIKSGLENPEAGAESLAADASCDIDPSETDEDGYYAYGTRIFKAHCNKVNNGNEVVDYDPDTPSEPSTEPATNPSSPSTTQKNNNNNNNNQNNNNNNAPDTGVEDYFLVLGLVGISLIGTFYFLDKKNIFKRI